MRRIFGSKRDEITEEWRELHKEELNGLNCLPSIFRLIKSKTRWTGNVARMGQRGAYGFLMRNPEVKRPFVRPRRRWEDNIKMDIQEVGCGDMDRIDLA